MKKFKTLAIYLSLVLTIIIACTKEVGVYTEVEFEISETHVADGFINTLLATSITVTPEELVEGYSYTYSYKINTGEGYFQDIAGNTIAEGEKVGLSPLSASLNYIATKIGDHSITFTAEDTFGFQEQVTASYVISDVPVTWTATGPSGQVLLGSSQDITVTLGNETTATGVTYERNYSFSQGTGTITSSPSGTSEILNEFVSITPGTYTLTYVATELGQTTLEFLLKDSNGQEILQTVSFEVVDELSTEKEITSFIVNGVEGTIVGTDITIELPEGTDLTTLSPIIIHTGASISPESETSQDFTNPVIYTVTAQDQTIQEYTVILTVEGNDAKDITDFAINGVAGTITGTNISVTLPAGTDVTALEPTVTHTGATISPVSDAAQDFTNPVIYTVTAEDASTQEYTITVTVAPSDSKDIIAFSIDGINGTITGTDISITLPSITDVTALEPTVTHTGATVSPVSGVAQDFTNPVIYTVTAEDASTQEYTVTVTVAQSDSKDITTFTIDGETVNNPATAFTITLPAGTDVTALSPSIIHTGASINPASDVAQNFTSPVEYTVTAADGTTQIYTVTVNLAAPLSSDKDITSFSIDGETMNDPATTFVITLPAGTDVTALSPTIIQEGNSINPASGAAQDFTSPVEYTVTAEDGTTQVYTVTVNLAINNLPSSIPTIRSRDNTAAPEDVLFTGVSSTDSDGEIIQYQWNFGDLASGTDNDYIGYTSVESNVLHTFNSPGMYTITLIVTDNDGGTDTSTITITVEEPIPTATFTNEPELSLANRTVTGALTVANGSISLNITVYGGQTSGVNAVFIIEGLNTWEVPASTESNEEINTELIPAGTYSYTFYLEYATTSPTSTHSASINVL
ncbi:PKD domain-containing protein [Cellulophaga sp. HaHa_2_1]|uniref:PKD domain-containing protein n=1 Tax=Cellulophaga sp. HaHa_2_1 TaxID=2749994 RepID=UPI001C4ED956|nr:PKD domain-containing protein [Cellulophaga sp. HaHa_2_1]QXP52983.1 PKD domain-containing protein [Cellulophaga sp. HaHa_2_1]